MGKNTTSLTTASSITGDFVLKGVNPNEPALNKKDQKFTASALATFIGSTLVGSGLSAAVTAVLDSNFGSTYSNGVLTATSNGAFAADSATLLEGSRVWLIAQNDATQNGIYDITTLGDGSTAAVLTRSVDMGTSTALNSFLLANVLEGTEYSGTIWGLTNVRGSLLLDTDELNFKRILAPFHNTVECVGDLVDIDFTTLANLDDFTTDTTSATIQLDGVNGLEISGNTAGSFDERIDYDNFIITSLNYEIYMKVEILQIDANSFGISVGLNSTNTTTPKHYDARIRTQSSSLGHIQVFADKTAPHAFAGESRKTLAVNDVLELRVRRHIDRMTVSYNFEGDTTYVNSVSSPVAFDTGVGTLGNVGKLSINNFGGDYRIKQLKLKSYASNQVDFIFCGDSITASGNSDGVAGKYYSYALHGFDKTYNIFAGGGNRTVDLEDALPEIKAYNPTPQNTVAVISIGTNDVAASTLTATIVANIRTIVDDMEAHGFKEVIVCLQLPRVTVGANIVTLNDALITEFSASNILCDFFAPVQDTALTTIDANYDSGDGIHPNALGNRVMGGALQQVLLNNNLLQ